jgi:hypothetical protein
LHAAILFLWFIVAITYFGAWAREFEVYLAGEPELEKEVAEGGRRVPEDIGEVLPLKDKVLLRTWKGKVLYAATR